MSYYNADGLRVLTNNDQGAVNNKGISADVDIKTLVVDVDLTSDISAVANDPFIPAGSYIKSATAIVTEAAAGGTSVNIGLSSLASDGTATVIDADGIDAGVLTAALAANKVVECNGVKVGGQAAYDQSTVGTENAYVTTAASGTYTAGKFKLVIEYIEV